MMEDGLQFLAMALYVASSVCFLLGIRRSRPLLEHIALATAGVGGVAHGVSICWRGAAGGYFPLTNLPEGLSFLAWCMVAASFITFKQSRSRQIGSFALPLAAVLLIAVVLVPGPAKEPALELSKGWVAAHASTALLSYGAFGLAFVAGLMYLLQERQIKLKRSGTLFRWLPSLERLERVDSRAIEIAFPLLTLSMLVGLLWARMRPDTGWAWGGKETSSLVTWLCYAALLHAKRRYSLRGRKVAYLCILGFVLVLFTFVGASLLFPGAHSYGGR